MNIVYEIKKKHKFNFRLCFFYKVFYITWSLNTIRNSFFVFIIMFYLFFYSYSYEIEAEKIFDSTQECTKPVRVLIDGEPGIGKSTLCCKLVYDWSTSAIDSSSRCSRSGIGQFDLVFLLKARTLAADRRMLDAVYDELFPDDFRVSRADLAECVDAIQDRVLFVVDGYDELQGGENADLVRLVRRKILSRCTVLVTSRPGCALRLLGEFDAFYIIVGYGVEKRCEFVDRYATELVGGSDIRTSCMLDRLRRLLETDDAIADLCCNPLNLSILCMLFGERSGSPPRTRTELFSEVVEFVVHRAGIRLGLSDSRLQEMMNSLYELSLDILRQNRFYIDEHELKLHSFADSTVMENLGFFTKEVTVCRLQPVMTFMFSHRNFVDFFAAKRLLELAKNERHSILREMTRNRSYHTTCAFLFGLLAGSELKLLDTIRTLFHEIYNPLADVAFHKLDHYDVTLSHHQSHLLLQCLAELDDLVISSPAIRDAVLKCCSSSNICFSHPWCNVACIRGFLKICSLVDGQVHYERSPSCSVLDTFGTGLNRDAADRATKIITSYSSFYQQKSAPEFLSVFSSSPGRNSSCQEVREQLRFDVIIPADCLKSNVKSWSELLVSSSQLRCINSIAVYNVTCISEVSMIIALSKVGHPHSRCRQLKLSFVSLEGTLDELPTKLFGSCLSRLELCHCPSSTFLAHCLEDIKDGSHLENLRISMSKCCVEPACCRLLSRKLATFTNLRSFSFTGHSLGLENATALLEMLRSLGSCQKLRTVKVSHLPAGNEMNAALEMLLDIYSLEELSISHSPLSVEVFGILGERLSRFERLRRLSLSHSFTNCPVGMEQLWTVIKDLQHLEALSFLETELSETDFARLGETIAVTQSLKNLSISPVNSSMVEHISNGLRLNRSLCVLDLKKVGFASGSIEGFASALQEHPVLETLILSMHPGYCLTDPEIHGLLTAVRACTTLTRLELRHFELQDKHVDDIGDALLSNETIEHANFIDNRITPDGVNRLTDYLCRRRVKLTSLDLSDCFVTDSDVGVARLREHTRYLVINWF